MTDFEVNLYDRAFKWLRPIAGWTSMECTAIHNDAGVTTFGLPSGNPAVADLLEPGSKVQISFRGKHLTSGLVRSRKGTTRKGRGPVLSGTRFFSVMDDNAVLKQIRAWPAPSRPVTQQGDEDAYYSIGSAPAETVLKDVVTKNIVQRVGMPFTVEPNQSRGGNILVQFRNHPIYDRMFPAFDLAGLGYRIRTQSGGRRLEVYAPRAFPFPLDEENRVIRDGDWNLEVPTVSRGLVAGQGQGTERHFETFRDAAREALWGEVWEASVDARDTASADAYSKRAAEALLEGSAQDSISLDLIETGRFVFGGEKGVQLGDRVTAKINGGALTITDVLREVTLKENSADGLKIEATIGVKDDPTTPVQAAISALAKAVRDMKAGQ